MSHCCPDGLLKLNQNRKEETNHELGSHYYRVGPMRDIEWFAKDHELDRAPLTRKRAKSLAAGTKSHGHRLEVSVCIV